MKSLMCAALSCLLAGAAGAATLAPASYDLNNGHGTASGGSFNYWDLGYTGSGSTNVDNALLGGGLGDLTDGVVTNGNWLDVEGLPGTGPYVGWRSSVLVAPAVRFHFAQPVLIDTIRFHADDSAGAGGVGLPASVTIHWDGGAIELALDDPDPGSTGPSWYTIPVAISGTSVRLEFGYANEWIFIDEVSFAGSVVPEAGTLAQFGLGLAMLAAFTTYWRRRR